MAGAVNHRKLHGMPLISFDQVRSTCEIDFLSLDPLETVRRLTCLEPILEHISMFFFRTSDSSDADVASRQTGRWAPNCWVSVGVRPSGRTGQRTKARSERGRTWRGLWREEAELSPFFSLANQGADELWTAKVYLYRPTPRFDCEGQ